MHPLKYIECVCNMVSTSKKRGRISPYAFRILGATGRFIKEEVEISFRPEPKKKGVVSRSILPTFNRDRKHYTPTFRLPSIVPQKDEEILKEHERRVLESQLEITQILYPKPRSRHKYCGVCKDYYQDYKQHVEGSEHLQALRRSPFQRLIIEAADKIGEAVGINKEEDDRTVQSNTEDMLFKCISVESGTELKRELEVLQ